MVCQLPGSKLKSVILEKTIYDPAVPLTLVNELLFTVVILLASSMVTEVKAEHRLNALFPILVTEFPIVTEVKAEH